MGGRDGTDDAAALRDAFVRADYTVDGVQSLLGPTANAALARRESVPARRALRAAGSSPLATLVRLFLLGDAVPDHEAAAALPLEPTLRLGLIRREAAVSGGEVRALLDARPYDEGFYVVSDLATGLDGEVHPVPVEHVLGVGGASVALTGLTIPGTFDRVLDLGTGCGVQAFHLSRRAGHVVATDVLPRALELARLGAALSEVDVDLRLGSMLHPVVGERFDLIVSNPPFVVGAASAGSGRTRLYRDGGLAGDEFCRRLVAAVPDHLADGGWCQLLANWVHLRDQDWAERVHSWLPPGCDAWALQREVLDPAAYVSLWLHDAGDVAGPEYTAAYDAWLDALEREGVEGIGFGWIALRRTGTATPLRRVEEWPHAVDVPLGPHIGSAFARVDWLQRHGSDEALAGARLRLAEDVLQELVGRPGAEDPDHVILRQRNGFRRARLADTASAALAGACDGAVAVGVLVDAVAILLDQPPEHLRESLLPIVRELVADGFLEPA